MSGIAWDMGVELPVLRSAEAFLVSRRYEYLFWEMTYRQKEWPV
ncbi:MAG: hypothetical protein ACE5JQ_01900 [Candidatus Methylomirabilales bacterium]